MSTISNTNPVLIHTSTLTHYPPFAQFPYVPISVNSFPCATPSQCPENGQNQLLHHNNQLIFKPTQPYSQINQPNPTLASKPKISNTHSAQSQSTLPSKPDLTQLYVHVIQITRCTSLTNKIQHSVRMRFQKTDTRK